MLSPSDKADILVVDDNLQNLQLLSALLAESGYSVRKALNARAAQTAIDVLQPDLILLDIMMPETDGYAFCESLKASDRHRDIPVVFLSALGETFDKVRAFATGGVDYITKPFQVEEVLVRVRTHLELHQARKFLEDANAELDRRVRERTAALEAEIAERRSAQQRLQHLACHDALTGLPNRMVLAERLAASLARLRVDPQRGFALLFLDCDRFKRVNDSLGHLAGDRLLVEMGQRLQACLGSEDLVSRFGGDEFAVLLDGVRDADAAIAAAERLRATLVEPFFLKGRELYLDASIGIVLGSPDYDDTDRLLRDADTAMYRAKADRDCPYRIFDAAMHQRANRLLQLESELRAAVADRAFQVAYQPIANLGDRATAGFEALARWHHPHLGWVSPEEFIPLAEEMNLIADLGLQVLEAACGQLRAWQAASPRARGWTVSANLSARQILRPEFLAEVDGVLARSGCDPRGLKLEITESALIEDTDRARGVLERLRDRGIRLSLDDFGTGYAALSYLYAFPIDTLKLDRSFVSGIADSPEHRAIVAATTHLARELGMTVVAEGVETAAQLAQLEAMACDFGQGYFFAKPLPPEAIDRALERGQFPWIAALSALEAPPAAIAPPQPVRGTCGPSV